jgi:hypothetical protein
MKKFYLITAALVCSNVLSAQDIITLKSGDEIKAKVQEIGTDNVKYKKYDNQNGPTYTLMKSDIFMIKYENGDKDVFKGTESAAPVAAAPAALQRGILSTDGLSVKDGTGKKLTDNEARDILAAVPNAVDNYNYGNNLIVGAYVLYACGLGSLVGMAASI